MNNSDPKLPIFVCVKEKGDLKQNFQGLLFEAAFFCCFKINLKALLHK